MSDTHTPRTDALIAQGLRFIWGHAKDLKRELQQKDERIAQLQSWKDQQMQVESEWNPQELAKMLGGTLGISCRKIIQEKVPELVAQIAALRDVMIKYVNHEYEVHLLAEAQKALSSPPPPVVPQSQYDELKADAEVLADAISRSFINESYKSLQILNQALVAFRAKHPQQDPPKKCIKCCGSGSVEIQNGPYERPCDYCKGTGLRHPKQEKKVA